MAALALCLVHCWCAADVWPRSDDVAKRKAMEDQLRVKEAVNLHHRSIVRFHSGVVEAVQVRQVCGLNEKLQCLQPTC